MGGGSKRKLAQQLGITPVLTAEEKPEAALRAYLSRPETDGP
jgi:hypothetical protein